jgi:hypothetical protein
MIVVGTSRIFQSYYISAYFERLAIAPNASGGGEARVRHMKTVHRLYALQNFVKI